MTSLLIILAFIVVSIITSMIALFLAGLASEEMEKSCHRQLITDGERICQNNERCDKCPLYY